MDVTVYYCWSCDAHRKVLPLASGETLCPCCSQVLSREAQLCTLAVRPQPDAKHALPRASAA